MTGLAAPSGTQAALDRLIIEDLLDERDLAPACEWSTDKGPTACGALAAWLGIFSCGHEWAYCEPHHEEIRARFARGLIDACRGTVPPTHAMMRVTLEWRRIPTGGKS